MTGVWADRRGVTALEFALVGPAFLLMVLGIVEVSRILTAQQLLDMAAREASRVGITGVKPEGGKTREQMVRDIVEEVVTPFLDPARVTLALESYPGFQSIGKPEPFADLDGNGGWAPGEPYTDVNGNGRWDEDQGRSGSAGSGGQVVIYRLGYENSPVTALFAKAFGRDTVRYSARVVVRNEPFRE